MLRPTDEDARRIEKLTRINQALIQRMERMDEMRGSSYALTRTAAMLEREIMERNADLERALPSSAPSTPSSPRRARLPTRRTGRSRASCARRATTCCSR